METGLSVNLPAGSGLENITQEDIGVQYLKYPEGKFICIDLGLEKQELTCRILTSYYTRAYYENREPQLGKQPDCKSYNGFVPSDSVTIPQARYCKEKEPSGNVVIVCDKAKWHNFPDEQGEEKQTPPKCKESLNMTLILEDMPQIAFILPLRGRNAQESGKNFLVARKLDTIKNNLSLCDARVKISIQKDKKKNQYFVPVFELIEWKSDDNIKNIFAKLYKIQ